MNKSKTILKICKVLTTGATNHLYEKVDTPGDNSTYLLKGSSIDQYGGIIEDELDSILIKGSKSIDRFKLYGGDVVLLNKGTSIRSAYVNKNIAEKNVIASANFIILRPIKNFVVGEFLVSFFNSDLGQTALKGIASGAVIQNVSLSKLKELEITLPDLNKQNKISELFQARNQAYSSALKYIDQQKNIASIYIEQLLAGVE